ncbi:hypothetical protein ACTPD5_22815, partial [Clostridioides difficile]
MRAGLPAIGVAVALNLFGHGLALSTDFVIQGAPTKATAGVGQKNQERTNITNPVTKNAVLEFFITLENGLTIY